MPVCSGACGRNGIPRVTSSCPRCQQYIYWLAEAAYVGVAPGLPVGEYSLTVGDVPVDGFWSISVYNADGFFEPNPTGVYSVNSITAVHDPAGSITVRFGDHGPDAPNSIPITEGWNYAVRLYQPRPEILEGTWQFPTITDA